MDDDLVEFKKVTDKFPAGIGANFCVLAASGNTTIIKARFFCRCLKRRSLRIVYAYHGEEERIVFMEIFFKGDKPREDGHRIKRYLSVA